MVEQAALDKSVVVRPTANGAQPPSARSDYLLLNIATAADDIEPWEGRPKLRDKQLREFYPRESHFASSLGAVCARNAAFGWRLEGGPRVVRQMQDVLENANDGEGWHDLILRLSEDLYTTDNGAFLETVRDGDTPDSTLIALNQLDSMRCYHTGDPRAPVVYLDTLGKYHLLNWYQVVTLAEMPSPVERMYGRQMCALSRVLNAAKIVRDVILYQQEKVGGRFNKAVHIVKGITTQALRDGLESAQLEMDQKGLLRFSMVPMVGIPEPEGELKIATLQLASLPENFSQEEMMKWYITIIALGFLSDYQDFAPLSGGNLGSSMQSQILHLKGQLKGAALFRRLITHALNRKILPKTVEFQYEEQDLESEKTEAEVRKVRAEGWTALKTAAGLPDEAIRQMAVDTGDISQELFDSLGQVDMTQTEKVEGGDNPDVPPDTAVTLQEPQAQAGVPGAGTKEGYPDEGFPFDRRLPSAIDVLLGRKAGADRAGPFDAERLKAERRLQTLVGRGLRAIQTNVEKRLKSEYRPGAKETALGFKAKLLDDEAFWRQQRTVLVGELEAAQGELLRQGVAQASRLGLAVNWDLANAAVMKLVPSYTDAWWKMLTKTTRTQLKAAIEANIATGAPLKSLVKDIAPIFGKDRAQLIATTEVTRLFTEGNLIAYKAGNVKQVEWRTVQDARVDPLCEALHGNRYPVDSPERPPLHPACLPGDSLVSTVDGVSAVSKRWYDGDLVVIDTAAGHKLSCTPNHPILTTDGWIPAGLLNVGSHVVSSVGSEWKRVVHPYGEDGPTRIQDVAETFGRSLHVAAVPVPVSGEDFHGDGVGSEVAVVWSDGLLGDDEYSPLKEHVPQGSLDPRHAAAALDGLRHFNAMLGRLLDVPGSFVRSPELALAGSGRHSLPLQSLSLSAASRRDSLFEKASIHGEASYAVPSSQTLHRLAGQVTADEVVHVDRHAFHGHVFNLQTRTGIYIAEGIVTHNCRCWLSPIANDEAITKAGVKHAASVGGGGGGGTVFHGTPIGNAEAIVRQGIVPGGGAGGTVAWPGLSDSGVTYVTTDARIAESMGASAAMMVAARSNPEAARRGGQRFVVFEVGLPEAVQLRRDPAPDVRDSYVIAARVQPSWIRNALVYETRSVYDSRPPRQVGRYGQKERTVYVPMIWARAIEVMPSLVIKPAKKESAIDGTTVFARKKDGA